MEEMSIGVNSEIQDNMPESGVPETLPTNENVEEIVPVKNMYGLRINFVNGAKMQFQFSDQGSPKEIATEINDFIQDKVELLNIRGEDTVNKKGEIVKGKRPFRASDVLPRRKATIDILYNGANVKSSLLGVPCYPFQFFENGGRLFNVLVNTLLNQAQKRIAKGQDKVAQIAGE